MSAASYTFAHSLCPRLDTALPSRGLARSRVPPDQPMSIGARRCTSARTALMATSLAVRGLASLGIFRMANRNVPNVPSATTSW